MKLGMKHILVLLWCACLGMVPSVSFGGGTGQFSQLTVEVTIEKSHLLPVEPIVMTLSLRNDTNKPIKAHGGLCFLCGYVELYVGQAGGARTKIQTAYGSALMVIPERILEPGEIVQKRETLKIDLQKNFPEYGSYTLHGVLFDLGKHVSIQSPPVNLIIHEPQGINQLALKHMAALFEGQAEQYWIEGDFDIKETFLLLFTDSEYAPYDALSLGTYYGNKNPEKSIAYLNRAANAPNFPGADEALYQLTKVYHKSQRSQDQAASLQRLLSEHPRSLFAKRFHD